MGDKVEHLMEEYKASTSCKATMNGVCMHAMNELSKVNRHDWAEIFSKLYTLQIIDESKESLEYCAGLIEYSSVLYTLYDELCEADLSFLAEKKDVNREIFFGDLIVATCLLNDTSCYEAEEKEIVQKIGQAIIRKSKHDESYKKLLELSDTSRLFNDPIDVTERNQLKSQ